MSIIEVRHLTKEYRLGQLEGIRQSMVNSLARITGKPKLERERFKALDDVSFGVEKGEVVGIIGHNGAGKSTLLKLLAGISTPTSGVAAVHGSVAPLIEVGAGVNPELTGRENIFLNGAILGIPRKVIAGKLDEIIAFSELEQFIDTPVKRYSSGMTVRLGFSIATSMDAEILIVDEVLAVGDLAFQRKCFDRMEELIKKRGKTVLLVSHNIRQIVRMCSRVILLQNGQILEDGAPSPVCDRFYEYSNTKIEMTREKRLGHVMGGSACELRSIRLISEQGESNSIVSGKELSVRILLAVKEAIKNPEIVIGTHTTDFVYLTGNSTDEEYKISELRPGLHEITCTWPHFPLKPGAYCLRLVVFNEIRGPLLSGDGLAMFKVLPANSESSKPPLRLLDIPMTWEIGECADLRQLADESSVAET